MTPDTHPVYVPEEDVSDWDEIFGPEVLVELEENMEDEL